ncbi:hypothetical protein [Kordia jejudonensis]|nr:hypothetical protein [Kordia jejudonensis]
MKKQHLKSLALNKRAISSLKFNNVKGGKKQIDTLYQASCPGGPICDTTF